MIRRPPTDGTVAVITQPAHAAFAGFLAQHLGNARFAGPQRRDAFVAAVTHHDDGWTLHDHDAPTLNREGQPLHVFEVDMMLATRIWGASADRAAASLPPYSALLVSLHQLHLSDFARRTFDSTPHERARTPKEMFELNKFQHRQVELQETFRRAVGLRTDLPLHLGLAKAGASPDEDALRFHFHLLTLCDRLSLQLCCAKLLFSTIEGIEPEPGATPINLTTRFLDPSNASVELSPWPFDVPRLSADVVARTLPAEPMPSDEVLRAAFSAAAPWPLTLSVCAAPAVG